MLVIDQPFAGFLTNYFSTHIRWNFGIIVLKLIPSVLICEEKYQKISFHKVTQDWLFWHGAQIKVSLFSFFFLFYFLLISLLFFFFFFFLFAFLGKYGELIFKRVKIDRAPWKLKVNFNIWSSWPNFSFFFFFESLSHSSIR